MSENTVYALAITTGLVAQIVLQVMAKMDAIKIAKQQKDSADAIAARQENAAKLVIMAKNDLGHQLATQSMAAAAAASKVEDVKEALAVQNDVVARQLSNIHTLVNSNMATQLKLNLELSEWKVSQIRKDPDHDPEILKAAIAAAEESKTLYEDHVKKQTIVDIDKK